MNASKVSTLSALTEEDVLFFLALHRQMTPILTAIPNYPLPRN